MWQLCLGVSVRTVESDLKLALSHCADCLDYTLIRRLGGPRPVRDRISPRPDARASSCAAGSSKFVAENYFQSLQVFDLKSAVTRGRIFNLCSAG